MASLAYLEPHLDALSTPEALNDENLHPAVALAELFDTLNTTDGTQRTCYPPGIVQSVDNMSKGWLHNEQQDAQEFFQKLTNALEKEVTEYIKRTRVVSGLESLSGMMVNKKTQHDLSEKHLNSKIVRPEFKNPFEGLLAQRVGCLQCGYVEGVRLQAFTSLSLPLPSSVHISLASCFSHPISLWHLC